MVVVVVVVFGANHGERELWVVGLFTRDRLLMGSCGSHTMYYYAILLLIMIAMLWLL
jgi:hypothetical protein